MPDEYFKKYIKELIDAADFYKIQPELRVQKTVRAYSYKCGKTT